MIRPERFAAHETPVRAMIRYRAAPAPALATVLDDGRLRLRFERPQRAISPGQLVALLDPSTDEVLGAATISGEAERTALKLTPPRPAAPSSEGNTRRHLRR